MTDALCVKGIRYAARSLRRAVDNGHDKNAREEMSLASLFGGMSLANAGLGAVHGFAGPIGGMFPAPHGAICAVLLPQVMEANLRALRERDPHNCALERYDEIAQLLTGNSDAVADHGVEWVRQLVADLQIPRLGTYGVNSSHISELVEKARNSSSMKPNPIALTSDELAGILINAI
jgi:alcohol dehydrogenase class IV